jgi:hypothetical protein
MKKLLFCSICILLLFLIGCTTINNRDKINKNNKNEIETTCQLQPIKIQDGNWGYIDKKGNVVIPFKYDCAKDFSEDLAAIQLNEKWGFINEQGEIVIPCKFSYADSFSEGLALVFFNGNWGYINKKGEVTEWFIN